MSLLQVQSLHEQTILYLVVLCYGDWDPSLSCTFPWQE